MAATGLTQKQLVIKARKFRLMAGELRVEMDNDKLPMGVRALIANAHDTMCKAFTELERHIVE